MSSKAERFAQLVYERRMALELNQLELAAAGGPSNSTQTEIHKAALKDLSPNIAKKLDRSLRWEPGSARRAWLGGDPIPLEAVYPPDLERWIAEVEATPMSDALKRYIINDLKERHERAKGVEAG